MVMNKSTVPFCSGIVPIPSGVCGNLKPLVRLLLVVKELMLLLSGTPEANVT